MTYDLIFVIQE